MGKQTDLPQLATPGGPMASRSGNPLTAIAHSVIAAIQLLGAMIIWLVILMPLWGILLGMAYRHRREWEEGLRLDLVS